jgi:dCMP deaminase
MAKIGKATDSIDLKHNLKPNTVLRYNENFTHSDYLAVAYLQAELESTDPSTQNGAVIVNPSTGAILCLASNHFPRGVVESKERWEKPLKYSYVEYAERNVIFEAARLGVSTQGMVMYCPWFACADCARAIIQAGIKTVYGHQDIIDLGNKLNPSWNATIAIANQMLDEAGIERKYVVGKIGPTVNFRIKTNNDSQETPYRPKIRLSGQVFEM